MAIAQFSTPILLVVFNRPDTTRQVFENLRALRPAKLFVAADGPRATVENDRARCAEVRGLVSAVDWPCEVQTLFREENLGCGPGVSTAIDWFFEKVEAGIILEDDCLPSRSFYTFCQELLEKYRENEQVMHISGNNYQAGRKRGTASYYFSRFTHNWGWATWRRAWQFFEPDLIPAELRNQIWDQQWLLSVEKHHGVAVLPNANLIKNIGFGPTATHTKTAGRLSSLEAHEMEFPLVHPAKVELDQEADRYTRYVHFQEIPSEKLIWLYELSDAIKDRLRPYKKMILG